MSDWLVHLVQLAKVGNHPNGENLSITTVYGQPVQERHVQFDPGNRHAFTGRVIFKFVGEDYKTRKKKG